MTPDTIRPLATGTVLAIALMLTPPAVSRAVIVCSEPLEPICVGNEETYANEALIERCSSDVETFLAETDEYVACLKEQSEAKRREAEQLATSFRERADNDGNGDGNGNGN